MSTTYNELCEAYTQARKFYYAYRNESYEFAYELYKQMFSYLGCSEDSLKLVPGKAGYDEKATYTPEGAMHLAEDSFWHLGFILELKVTDGKGPSERLGFMLMFKKSQKGFSVKTSSDGTEFDIVSGDSSTFRIYFDHLFGQVKVSYETGLGDFLNAGKSSHNIGFDISKLHDAKENEEVPDIHLES